MTTKQDVADFLNESNVNDVLTAAELEHMQERVDPLLANILVKFVGDVSWLIEIRDNLSREVTNRKS
jgi:hypothetical protein